MFSSLRLKMLATMLFGAALGVLLFIVINLGIKQYIKSGYLSDENKAEREKSYREDLQKYVTENGLTANDADSIANWAQKHKYVYVLIYKDDELLFESGRYDDEEKGDPEKENPTENNPDKGEENPPENNPGEGSENPPENNPGENGNTDGDGTQENGPSENPPKEEDPKEDEDPNDDENNRLPGITVKPPSREELIANAQKNGSYPIYTADGGVLLASMADYSEYLYYDIANIASIIVALAVFIITMWVHFYGITKRITKLGKEVTVVADGNMQHRIESLGNDEISRLSMDVDYMRTSMLDNVQKEHNALEANKELITAMSHDIRTPLTVLLGYLDIMKLNVVGEDMKNYIDATEATALRLKKMSDDMFGYFLAYGSDIEVDIQECNARTLVEQMIPGHVFLLREQGYDIEYSFEEEKSDFLEDAIVITDPPQLMRIVENIFSNVMKYADKEKPISINVGLSDSEMTIKVSNYISENPDGAQKNGIGLRSCAKLANAMDVRFSSCEEEGLFVSRVGVPLISVAEYEEIKNEKEKRGIKKWSSFVLQKLKAVAKKLWNGCAQLFKKKPQDPESKDQVTKV